MRDNVVRVLFLLWTLLRYVFALAGFVCLLLTVTTLTNWLTVAIEGEQLEWYWLLSATLILGLISTLGPEPFPGVSREGPRLGAPDRRLGPSLGRHIPRMMLAMLLAGAWGGLTYLLGLDVTVIFPVAALVGIGYAFSRPRESGTLE